MKKALLILLSLIILPANAASSNKKMIPTASDGENMLPNIFIYTLPDDSSEEPPKDIPVNFDKETKVNEEDIVTLDEDNITIGATTLKGYAQYLEDSSVIHLKDSSDSFVLNIKEPQKISSSKGLNLSSNPKQIQRYTNAEYVIAPGSIKSSDKVGNFTIGATYDNEVDNIAMLETEAGLFTKYEKNKFALSSSVKKSLNTTYAQDYNTISIAPELKLNNHISLKNVLSADITRNRRSSKLVFSVSPLKDIDRLFLELGAKQTIYLDNDFTKTEFSFSTTFKL